MAFNKTSLRCVKALEHHTCVCVYIYFMREIHISRLFNLPITSFKKNNWYIYI